MGAFQNAKDTFYVALRDRLLALNAERTTAVRGVTRVAVVVDENELAVGTEPDATETFLLRWTEAAVDGTEGMALERGRCEIRWSVAGSPEVAGMDRGRVAAAMEAELLAMLQPAGVVKQAYDSGAAVAQGTQVFWSDAVFGPTKMVADRLARTAVVDVFAWKEAA